MKSKNWLAIVALVLVVAVIVSAIAVVIGAAVISAVSGGNLFENGIGGLFGGGETESEKVDGGTSGGSTELSTLKEEANFEESDGENNGDVIEGIEMPQ